MLIVSFFLALLLKANKVSGGIWSLIFQVCAQSYRSIFFHVNRLSYIYPTTTFFIGINNAQSKTYKINTKKIVYTLKAPKFSISCFSYLSCDNVCISVPTGVVVPSLVGFITGVIAVFLICV